MTELSNYKYIKTIGEGTFGKVKLAIHILTGEKVAIKILQKSLIKYEKQYQRIQNEIKYLKILNHPNIIKIYEVIENDSSFFIVMEYATSGELFNYIVLKEKLNEKEASFFFYQIIQGVRKIHEKKICHRDIKPENLLLTKKNIIKIIDFGLSSEYDEFLLTPCGSPCYASPEMIKGKKYKGLSVDLWACGVILFAMLFGYLPFDDVDNNVLFKKIINCEIDFPEENEIDVGKDGVELIKRILNPEPEKRINIDEVEKHPFLEYGKKEYEKLFAKDVFQSEDLIINYMENQLGFDNHNNIIQNNIYNNRHNYITTTYYLLKQKYLEGRLVFSFRERLYKKINNRSCSDDIKLNDYSKFNNNINKIKKINSIKQYQIERSIDLTQNNNNNNNKKSKTASRTNSNKNILSLKDIFNKNDFSENRNNIIIINNTNMIHEPQKMNSIYNNIILKRNSLKNNNINKKIETSVSQEKRVQKNKENNGRNSAYIKSANTYRNYHKINHIKVSLKKLDKRGNKFIYFKKINGEDSSLGNKYIKLPLNFSFKTTRRNYNNNILSYKKNLEGNQTVRKNNNDIHSFEVNTSNNINFNYSNSNKNLNAFSSFDISNINSSKFNIKKIRDKIKDNNINHKLINNDIFDSLSKNQKIKNRNDLNKRIDTKDILSDYERKSVIIKKKDNFYKNIDKICRIIFQQNKKENTNLIINKKTNYENNNINNNIIKKKQTKKNDVFIDLNSSSNEINNKHNTSRYNKIIKSINTFNTNNINNKILDKNVLSKNINYYFIPNNINQKEIRNSTNANIKRIKDMLKRGNNYVNNRIKKNVQSYKNLSPSHINNITHENRNLNVNTFKKVNSKTNKINYDLQKILSINKKPKKNKTRNEKNLYNAFYTEIDLSKNKINYVPITSREQRTNHSRNYNNNFSINNNINSNQFESNTMFLVNRPYITNNLLSNKKPNELNIFQSQTNNIYSKRLISNNKTKNTNKFLVTNTEMTLYQITNKIEIFCKENNLNYRKEGIYNIKIYNKNNINIFNVEIVHSTPMNIVKIFHGKNTGNNMKDIITKLFIDIVNYE